MSQPRRAKDFVAREIERRTSRAKVLAAKYPELARPTYTEFLEASVDAGLDLDFVTSCEMFAAYKNGRAEP